MRFRRHQEAAQAATLRLAMLFALVLLALVLAVNAVLALAYRLSFPMLAGYPNFFFETNTALVLLCVLGGCAVESLRLREGGQHVARLAGGRAAQLSGSAAGDRLERRFANIVQEMALASRHPAPAAWVLPRHDAINAFAAGWQPGDAVIVVTRGALERLTREELQGVVAHEFSHLVHGDTRLNMRLVGLVWGLQMIFGLGEQLAARDDLGRRGPGALFGFALMAVGSLGWAAGRLLQAAVSRQREYLADASAVQYTRQVDGLGGALRKIAQQAAAHADRLHTAHGTSLAHLWLHASGWSWWASHPPLAERLRRLYGRAVAPLPAEPLPLPPSDEPMSALAAAKAPGPPGDAGPPAALQHDPVQRAAALDGGEQEALDRLDRWHGAGQLRIAVLWLLTEAGPPEATARWESWSEGLHFADPTRRTLVALGPAARLRALELLAPRLAAAPPAERTRLRQQLRELGAMHPLRLHAVALRSRLRDSTQRLRHGLPWDRMAPQALAATHAMALALPLLQGQRQGWLDAAARELGLVRPAAVSAPAWRTAFGLRRLSAMDRPRLVRAWLRALPPGAGAGAHQALQMACWLLDSPLPPELGGPPGQ
ncbi:MAG: M48 family metalloprotease [Pseudomonadota bacterium]